MLRQNSLSKSTKRRRILDEINLIKHSLVDVSSPQVPNIVAPSSEISNNPNDITCQDTTDTVNNFQFEPSTSCYNTNFVAEINNINEFLRPENTDTSDSDLDNILSLKNSITENLYQWASENNVPNNTFDKLLKILKGHKCFKDLPVTSRTLYKMYSNVSYSKPVEMKSVSPGYYYHFGVAYNIKKHLDKQFSDETIKLVIGIDGLPLSKSSGSCFWPILGYIRQKNQTVFPIGIYWGHNKPSDSNIYIKDFVDEVKTLVQNGIDVDIFNNTILTTVHKNLVIDCFCCDMPAKSFLLKTKSHTGFFSCTRCTVQGQYLLRRVCFPNTECPRRTHDDFVNKIQRQYHSNCDDTTEILNIPSLDIVKNFSLDYMHVVCLGAVKKIMMLWKGGDGLGRDVNKQKLSPNLIKTISERLLSLKYNVSNDFSRKPRSLEELPRWKATEFRLFLLYIGPIAIQSILSKELYEHFLCLHVAMIIFLSPNYNNLSSFAQSLMINFVKKFGKLYGKHFISSNIHALIHLFEDYDNYGSLDTVSCFKFENYMSNLKKMVRKNDKPLQQVVRRCEEHFKPNILVNNLVNENDFNQNFQLLHSDGPLIDGTSSPQYKILLLDKIQIKTHSAPNSYVGLKIENIFIIIKILNICYSQDHQKLILLGRQFEKIGSFFSKPLKSEKLGIYKVEKFSKQIRIWNIEDVVTKYMILTINDLNVAYPIIHFNNSY